MVKYMPAYLWLNYNATNVTQNYINWTEKENQIIVDDAAHMLASMSEMEMLRNIKGLN